MKSVALELNLLAPYIQEQNLEIIEEVNSITWQLLDELALLMRPGMTELDAKNIAKQLFYLKE